MDISPFINSIRDGDIEIYNEFNLQHELGIFLRRIYPGKKVQFERNVTFFNLDKAKFSKKEIDISIFGGNERVAIELKFPRNGQHPEQMYSFCKDLAFMEELKASGFTRTYLLICADDPLFYQGRNTGIYSFFRGNKILNGTIKKPTGKCDTNIEIKGKYTIVWNKVSERLKYTLIEAQ